ncbi:TonB-dependent receptor [Flavisolibacter nicotianae]|uniref:TonB-dependent receptor n=1 Tax=Flavisolibacter nicotianae TaxID=2364882 RepID=UPI000EAD6A35|nr:TonB-dependent receptor [Flavisolibacter nicotianae]
MSRFYKAVLLAVLFLAARATYAQTNVKGKIIDATTKEPVAGATIHCTDENCHCGCTTNASGEFEMRCTDCRTLAVSYIGYTPQQFAVSNKAYIVSLNPAASQLQEVVLTANRGEGAKRSEAPIAITTITSKTIQDAKPTMADQVLNKVSGVNMVNLGNEQHEMSIRQPMTTRSLFLYLEDGIPIRTSGLYNHNALLEMNLAATKSIEVIKGPSSSLYGSEAIGGVVNFITAAPTAVPVLKLSAQGNNVGYKRADLMSSVSTGKWGFVLSGYYADKRNGYLEYSDFHKGTFTARADYHFSDKTTLSNSLTYLNYYSDMAGGIDSTMFASKAFSNPQTFTYRKVDALRYHSTLTHVWNDNSKTTVAALYRDNTIGQNPAYRVKDDYRKVNGVNVGKKDLAHGEINENRFHSYSLIAQHRQNLNWKKAVVIGGLNVDISPSTYNANYIRIKKDTISKKYVSYQNTDSTLTDYATKLNNYAAFLNVEFNPIEKLRVVASLRYDYFHYGFDNHLTPSAFSGSPDTVSNFHRVSPKVGFTYNFSARTGIYANYSEGFVPPQVTELYTGVKVPNLNPSIFYNYEVGGWVELVKNKLSIDVSAYRLEGTNEIISVKLDDGSFANQNAGRTLHRGIEAGLNATPIKDVSFRLSGAYSKHEFVDYVEKGVSYNGNEMANAPHWIYNAEVWYKPSFVKGFRIGAELQHVGSYFVDPQNTATYDGYNAFNLRAGYQFKGFDVWVNVLNATNNYYSYITTKSSFGWSYQLAEPRNFNVGVSYDFANLFKKNQ